MVPDKARQLALALGNDAPIWRTPISLARAEGTGRFADIFRDVHGGVLLVAHAPNVYSRAVEQFIAPRAKDLLLDPTAPKEKMQMRISAFVSLENGEVGKSLIAVETLDALDDQFPRMREALRSIFRGISTVISMRQGNEHVRVAIEGEATELLMTLYPADLAAPTTAAQSRDFPPGMA